MALKILLVSPYSSIKVGGIGTWSKMICDYSFERNRGYKLYFQNTAFTLKSNINKRKFARYLLGVIDTLLILLRLTYNMIVRRPDVVHYTSSASIALIKDYLAILIVQKIFKKKIVIHWRFGRIPELSKANNYEWHMLLKVVTLASQSIVIDNRSYETLLSYHIQNVHYIPNPISESVQQYAMQTQKKNLKRGKIVFAGHVIKEKGVFELVEACTGIDEDLELFIYGPYARATIDNLTCIADKKDNGRWLKFMGEQPREVVIEALRDANIMCLPSYTEGFPNIVLEAMAMGCAVIATTVGAIPEMLNCGAGICVPPKDIESLKAALLELLVHTDKAIEMGRIGNTYVLNNFTLSNVCSQYLQVWHQATLKNKLQ